MPRPQQGGTGGTGEPDAKQAGSSTADCWSASDWLTLPFSCGSYRLGGEHEVRPLPLPPAGVGISVLEQDFGTMKPLVEEVNQLRMLRIEVDLLWTHVRQLAERAGESHTFPLPCTENHSPHCDEMSSIQCLIREEVSRVLLHDDNGFHNKLRTSHAELQQQLCEIEQWVKCKKVEHLSTVDGTRKLLPGVEGDIRHLNANGQQPSLENELDFGAPIGKTLNTQDWLALHVDVKTEIQDCRTELVRLCRRVGCWSEASTKWAHMLPEDVLD